MKTCKELEKVKEDLNLTDYGCYTLGTADGREEGVQEVLDFLEEKLLFIIDLRKGGILDNPATEQYTIHLMEEIKGKYGATE